MVSLLSSLNIATNALSVNESAISVVSHNVANMNTEGYSKQRVNLATRNIAGNIGNNVEAQIRANGGVMIANVMRYNDDYLNNYYRTQLSELKQQEAQLDSLGNLAEIFNDLDGTGLETAMENFYKAVNNLNIYPASSTARTNFIESAKSLTSIINSKGIELAKNTTKALGDGSSEESLKSSQIYNQLGSVNSKLEEIAATNKALQVTQTGTLEANNLLDKRDKLLNELSEFVNITIKENDNGSVNVSVGDTELVKGSVVTGTLDIQTAESYCIAHGIIYPDDWDGAAAVVSIIDSNGVKINDNVNDVITGGSFGGLLHSADISADGMNAGKAEESLNRLARALAQVFNDLNTDVDHAYCIDPNDTGKLIATTADNYIFVNAATQDPAGITAATITINENLLADDGIWDIAAAYFEDPTTYFDEKAVGNGQNAALMLGTRTQSITDLSGMTIEEFYTSLVGKIAAAGNNAQTLVDTQQSVVDSIYNNILSTNSVDLNEELVDLVKYQTAYSASAQVFNKVNECLNILISLGG